MIKRTLKISILLFSVTLCCSNLRAQCSVCTKTAEQLGEKPGKGLNAGILYLMTTPLLALGFIGYRWWRKENNTPTISK